MAVTWTTALFDLGRSVRATTSTYTALSQYWEHVAVLLAQDIYLVVYTTPEFAGIMKQMRPRRLRSKTLFVTSPEFDRKKDLQKTILARKANPVNNSTATKDTPLFTLFTIAKFDFVAETIRRNFFDTKGFGWVDVGLSRVVGEQDMSLLGNLWSDSVALGQMNYNSSKEWSQGKRHFYSDFRHKFCGGLFFGNDECMQKMCEEALKEYQVCLTEQLAPSEEQLFAYLVYKHPQLFDPYMADYYDLIRNFKWVRKSVPLALTATKCALYEGDLHFALKTLNKLVETKKRYEQGLDLLELLPSVLFYVPIGASAILNLITQYVGPIDWISSDQLDQIGILTSLLDQGSRLEEIVPERKEATEKKQYKKVVVVVANAGFVEKAKKTCKSLRSDGNWTGDIVFVHGNDLLGKPVLEQLKKDVEIKYFPDVCCRHRVDQILKHPFVDATDNGREKDLGLQFQHHKTWIFSTYWRKWDRLLYVDAGTTFSADVDANVFEAIDCTGKIVAPLEKHGAFRRQWESKSFPALKKELEILYDMSCERFFINAVVLMDTAIIHDNTWSDLVELSNLYVHSRCNEMSIWNLYFVFQSNLWQPAPDMVNNKKLWLHGAKSSQDAIMVKYLF